MKKQIVVAALVAALGASAPLASMAAEEQTAPAVAPATATFEVVDPATGRVIGDVVPAPDSSTQDIAAMAAAARTDQVAEDQPETQSQPHTIGQWKQFWNQVLPQAGGG